MFQSIAIPEIARVRLLMAVMLVCISQAKRGPQMRRAMTSNETAWRTRSRRDLRGGGVMPSPSAQPSPARGRGADAETPLQGVGAEAPALSRTRERAGMRAAHGAPSSRLRFQRMRDA